MTSPTPREALEWLRTGATQGPNAEADAVLTALVERHEKLVLTAADRALLNAIGAGEPGWIDSIDKPRLMALITRAYTEPKP